jgi:hypothetical protein
MCLGLDFPPQSTASAYISQVLYAIIVVPSSELKTKCDNCRKEISVKPYNMGRLKHHFCSRSCHSQYITNEVLKKRNKCLNPRCGRPVNSKNAKFCSQSCFFTYLWMTKWANRTKGYSKWRDLQKGKETFIIKCPSVMASNFSMALKELVSDMNKEIAYRGIGTIEIRHGA